MIYQIVAIRDRSADVYGIPNFITAIGVAIRAFSDEVNRVNDNNMLNRHPEDFDLFHLGTYHDEDCSFEMLASPRQIAVGKDCIR